MLVRCQKAHSAVSSFAAIGCRIGCPADGGTLAACGVADPKAARET